MNVRPVEPKDRVEWLRMRCLLWSDSQEGHEREISTFFHERNPNLATFVIERGNNQLGGFLEARVRDYAEGCVSSRIGYVEGWYVDSDLRRQGLGQQLIQAAERWALSLGICEMASDCLVENEVSLMAHLAVGFEEVERIICFRKVLKSNV